MTDINKAQIAKEIHERVELTLGKTEEVIGATFDQIGEHLHAGQTVSIHGFGKFAVKTRAARTGRNPQTGAAIEIAESRVATFKAAKGLKDSVNK